MSWGISSVALFQSSINISLAIKFYDLKIFLKMTIYKFASLIILRPTGLHFNIYSIVRK